MCKASRSNKPRHEKTGFLYIRKQRRRSAAQSVAAQLISASVFAIRIIQSLIYLNPKFQASSHLLWLYSTICVGPGRKPRILVFHMYKPLKAWIGCVCLLFVCLFCLFVCLRLSVSFNNFSVFRTASWV